MTTKREVMELKPCPCGETPTELLIDVDENQGYKYAHTYGDCCNEWSIEFRSQYKQGDELMSLAVQAWNDSPRAELAKPNTPCPHITQNRSGSQWCTLAAKPEVPEGWQLVPVEPTGEMKVVGEH